MTQPLVSRHWCNNYSCNCKHVNTCNCLRSKTHLLSLFLNRSPGAAGSECKVQNRIRIRLIDSVIPRGKDIYLLGTCNVGHTFESTVCNLGTEQIWSLIFTVMKGSTDSGGYNTYVRVRKFLHCTLGVLNLPILTSKCGVLNLNYFAHMNQLCKSMSRLQEPMIGHMNLLKQYEIHWIDSIVTV